MSYRSGPRRLIEPELLGRWIVERWYIWLMRLLNSRQLAKFSHERGVGVSASSGEDVERLWQLGPANSWRSSMTTQAPKLFCDASTNISAPGTIPWERRVHVCSPGPGGSRGVLRSL
jgi:hypothetical protein